MSAKFWSDGNMKRERPDRRNGRAKFRGHHRDEIEAALAAEVQAVMEHNQSARASARVGSGSWGLASGENPRAPRPKTQAPK